MRDPAGRFVAVTWLLVGVLPAACSHPVAFAPPPMDVRQQLDTAALVAVPSVPSEELELPNPDVGSTALGAAGRGALNSIGTGLNICLEGLSASELGVVICGAGVAGGIVVAPVAALFGAANSRPLPEVEAAQMRLAVTLMELNATEYLRDRLVVLGAAQNRLRFEKWPYGPSYRIFAGQGPDTVIEVAVTRFHLKVVRDAKPEVLLELAARARVVRVADDEELYWRAWRYLGPRRDFFAAADKHADLLRKDVREGFDQLTNRVLSDLLLATEPDMPDNGEQPLGSVRTIGAPAASRS